MPEPETMDAEVGVALEDWDGIPTHELPGVCAEARRRANGFPPPNSLVVDAWQEERERRRRAERDRELYERATEPPPPPKTPEELAEMDAFFKGLRASLGMQ
jgi:hypothetical protein